MKMVEKYFSFDEICERADCVEVAKTIGLSVNSEGRCAATWRGGSNETSVSINKNGWHDFSSGESGSVIALVAKVKFDDEIQDAQMWLGEHLGLEPKMLLGKEKVGRENALLENGYELKNEYPYCDIEGKVKYIVKRYQHPENKKEFIQCKPDGTPGIKGIEPLLYRLNQWKNSDYVALCEGERDVETLHDKLGIFATTNSSGASRWEESYNQYLKGKNLILCVDNDPAGESRKEHLLYELKNICNKIKVIEFPDEAKGFDVSDYAEKYGLQALQEKLASTKNIVKSQIKTPKENYNEVIAAKEANKSDFSNYLLFSEEDENGKMKKTFKPRHLIDMIEDMNTRLLGFPRVIGTMLFDHDKDSGKIEHIKSPDAMIAWITAKTKKLVRWKAGDGFISKKEFFEGVYQASRKYNEIAHAPVIPQREDSYSAYPPLPEADSEGHYYFNKLIDSFLPATECDRVMIASFLVSPLWYEKGIPKPCFIIDSPDGQGSGKTKVAEICAYLYRTDPVRTDKHTLEKNFDDVTKRLVSYSGRECKIVLLDNVTGTFSCSRFADLVTASSISGRSPYGRGEESRPNNLTYVITSNNATIDSDMAERSLFIHVKKPEKYDVTWLRTIKEFIDTHRYNIFADMLDIIYSRKSFDAQPCTRFPDFEKIIMQAMCSDFNEYNEVIKSIITSKAEANVEEDYALQIRDRIQEELIALNLNYDQSVFIRSAALNSMFKDGMFPGFYNSIYLIRNLCKQGLLPEINKEIVRYPANGKLRARGILWNWEEGKSIIIIGLNRQNELQKIIS